MSLGIVELTFNSLIIRVCLFTKSVTRNMDELVRHIHRYCYPSKLLYKMNSYALTALFELLLDRYISNDEFKAAMRSAGFEPIAQKYVGINHQYKLRVIDTPDVPQMYRGRGYQSPKKNKGE